jgi:hypothetical protein
MAIRHSLGQLIDLDLALRTRSIGQNIACR